MNCSTSPQKYNLKIEDFDRLFQSRQDQRSDLEAEFARAHFPAGTDPALLALPASLTWVQFAKTIAELQAMSWALKMTS